MVNRRNSDEWGRVTASSEAIFEFMMQGGDPGLLLAEPSDAIERYNRECRLRDKSEYVIALPSPPSNTPEEEHRARAATWLFPERVPVDIEALLLDRCQSAAARDRTEQELVLFRERGLYPLLIAMVRMVEHLRAENILWGVGRGSSVASYCLYLIGVHRIDPLLYDIPISEFLKPSS